MEVASRVAAGAARLDADQPGWHRNVNVNTLDISSGSRCALGQTYGSYAQGVQRLGLTSGEASSLGFNTTGVHDNFAAITAEWRRLIEARLDEERAKWAVEQADHPVFRRYRKVPVGV